MLERQVSNIVIRPLGRKQRGGGQWGNAFFFEVTGNMVTPEIKMLLCYL